MAAKIARDANVGEENQVRAALTHVRVLTLVPVPVPVLVHAARLSPHAAHYAYRSTTC
eukprot:COSAG04_NODE_767_length_10483_cov_27.449398_7_plen_58_part_00